MADTPHALLYVLGTTVEEHDAEIGVTLLVHGAWISGMLTSYRRYLDAFATSFPGGATDDDSEFVESFASGIESAAGGLVSSQRSGDGLYPCVFLRRARVWFGDGSSADEI